MTQNELSIELLEAIDEQSNQLRTRNNYDKQDRTDRC